MADKDTNKEQVAHHEVELEGVEPYAGPDKNHEPLGAEVGEIGAHNQHQAEKKTRAYTWGADPNELNKHPDELSPISRNEVTHEPERHD